MSQDRWSDPCRAARGSCSRGRHRRRMPSLV